MSINVLLAEPDSALRTAYADAFRHSDLEVRTVATAAEAFEALDDRLPDVLITEVGAPGPIGPMLLREARDRDADLPIILLTGAPELESAMMAVNLGAFRYLIKPVAPSKLHEIIRRAALLRHLARMSHAAAASAAADGAHADLARRFTRALADFHMAYQPIVHASDRSVRGFEALLRTTGHGFEGPESLIHAATKLDRVRELGRRVRSRVAEDAADLPADAALFVNLLPADLLDGDLYSPHAPLSQVADRVVLELTERSPLDGFADLTDRVGRLRAMGYRIALDDVGAGYSGLASLTQLEPDIIKLDRALVAGVQGSAHRQAVVRSLVALCRTLRIELVGEGIEREAEAASLAGMGVEQLQGYLFSSPLPASAWAPEHVN